MMETPEQNRNVFAVKKFLSEYLDLRKDKDNELETVDSIRKGVEFKGANLWILIFAIFMASLGLNVNSTAVIIGAMLISPLMGPIMGVGLSVGLNDFELMKRSLKSFLITTLFSVTTATVFFLVSPVAEGQSELLARTSPTIYDVFIALMGGLAGVVALSTKEKGNVIPGVAILSSSWLPNERQYGRRPTELQRRPIRGFFPYTASRQKAATGSVAPASGTPQKLE